MKIEGLLRDRIVEGNAVLFVGAGLGQEVGLNGTKQLSNYLYNLSGSDPDNYKFKDDFSRLVSKLDKNSQFGREWTEKKLVEYFTNRNNYNNLNIVDRILMRNWKAIFTTNYDMSFEFASFGQSKFPKVLRKVTDPTDTILIKDTDPNLLKYFKIHGCVEDTSTRPKYAQPFVITSKDFAESSTRNKYFWDAFKDLTYTNAIIFLGFNGQKNATLLENLHEVKRQMDNYLSRQTKVFTVLKDLSEEDRLDLEELDITVLEGDIQDFVTSVELLSPSISHKTHSGEKIVVKSALNNVEFSREQIKALKDQFSPLYDAYLEGCSRHYEELANSEKIDLWKSKPSDIFSHSESTIERYQTGSIIKTIESLTNTLSRHGENSEDEKKESIAVSKLILRGERGCGKSVLARQIAKHIFRKNRNPILFLNESPSFIEFRGEEEEVVSGYSPKFIDSYLSNFNREFGNSGTVPILIADQVTFNNRTLFSLQNYLVNHDKRCLLILVSSNDEFERFKSDYKGNDYKAIEIKHHLEDSEIDDLFEKIKLLRPEVSRLKDTLVGRAKNEANRDILLALYLWFDEKYRKLNEILEEESEKINSNDVIKNFFLSVAVFQQHNFSPRIELCIKALGLSPETFQELTRNPLYHALVKSSMSIDSDQDLMATTRHPRYTQLILKKLIASISQEVDIIKKVFSSVTKADLIFVRDFMNFLYANRIDITVEQMQSIKDSIENNGFFKLDPVLNHQFAAYLIRDATNLDTAQYYLDLAANERPNDVMILHSKATLYKRRYEKAVAIKSNDANEFYSRAEDMFDKIRRLSVIPDEHDYVTEMDMITSKIQDEEHTVEQLAELNAKRSYLCLEAMKVIPKERQKVLIRRKELAKPFKELPHNEQKILMRKIDNGLASAALIEYYTAHMFEKSEVKYWPILKNIVDVYFIEGAPLDILTVVGKISKHAFILDSKTRFEILRTAFSEITSKNTTHGFIIVSEYMKLLFLDALSLSQYHFLKSAWRDYRELNRQSFPRFLENEYLLEQNFYTVNALDLDNSRFYYLNHCKEFFSPKNSKKFTRDVQIDANTNDIYFDILLDIVTNFRLRGIKRELQELRAKFRIEFEIKFSYDGFIASRVKTV